MKPRYERPVIVRHQVGSVSKFGSRPTIRVYDKFEGVPIATLVQAYGSPLILFSERILRERMRDLREQMARRAAGLVKEGSYVNLGIGIPTLVSNHLEGRDVFLHSENGILGYGPFPPEGEEDIDLYNASGQLVTALPETAYFDSTVSFAMARSGRAGSPGLGAN